MGRFVGTHLTSPGYEKAKASASQRFIEEFYYWLERVDAEKTRVERPGLLQHVAKAKTLESVFADRTPDSALVGELVGLCGVYVRRELRAYARMLGGLDLQADEAKELLERHVKEMLEHTYERKWGLGVRQLSQVKGFKAPFLLSLWSIVKDSVQEVRTDLTLDIEDGRIRARGQKNPEARDERTSLVTGFKTRMRVAGWDITDQHIWSCVQHRQARQFYFWKSGQDRKTKELHGATRQDDRSFRRVLQMNPTEFLEALRLQRIAITKKK